MKFYDEEYETELLDIDWTMGRTGVLTPVAVFKPVDTGDSIIERASMHNLSIMRELLGRYPEQKQKIWVVKQNMIIPQVAWGDKICQSKDSIKLQAPVNCPACGEKLSIVKEKDTGFLKCLNPMCQGKLINKLNHFCSKKGLDIKGLSLATLEKLMEWNWVNNIIDLYSLSQHKEEWIVKPGFGKKSVDNILQSIKNS
jgi:DNA ligase (NAD+)